jgi:hypothetical protein
MALPANTTQPVQNLQGQQGVQTYDDTLKDHDKRIERINNLSFYVVLVLLVTVGCTVATLFWNFQTAANQLQNDRYEFLEQRIDYLEGKRSLTPTITPTPTPSPTLIPAPL